MTVASLLSSKPSGAHTVLPWASVASALRRLSGPPRIGALVVTSEHGRVLGVLSERDIVKGLSDHGAELLNTAVETVMSQNVPTCSPEDSLALVMRTMTVSKFRYLLVVHRGDLLGVVSIGDVVSARVKETELETAVLRDMVVGGRSLRSAMVPARH